MARSSLATIGPDRVPLECLVCHGRLFIDREVMLNTGGMEFLGIELWKPDRGYPSPPPAPEPMREP
ncbi:MAG: hypothetical protein J2P28_00665 [Actinobacteria bacterium]|nr:hypothetical protein [Actinomycetota bacterium]